MNATAVLHAVVTMAEAVARGGAGRNGSAELLRGAGFGAGGALTVLPNTATGDGTIEVDRAARMAKPAKNLNILHLGQEHALADDLN